MSLIMCLWHDNESDYMYKYVYIYIYGMHKWCYYMYVSVYTVGCKQITVRLDECLY